MLYLVCPTCNTCLGDKQLIIEKNVEIICGDVDMNKITQKEADNLKSELITSFKVKYCCNTRLLSYIDQVRIIK